MPEGNPLGYVLLLIALIACNAFFAMSEIAVISFNDTKLRLLAEEGNKKAIILRKLTAEPSKFLATIQVGVTLSGFLASAVAADTFAEYIVYWLRDAAIPVSVVRMVSTIVITLLLSFVTLVFGELVPKRVATNNPEKISFAVSGVLKVVYTCTKPLVALLSATTNGVLRLIGINPHQSEPEVTEEEIRMMIDVGEEDGTIEQSEKEMLHNIFEFDDRTADDVMTHRTEIAAIDVGAPLETVISTSVETGHSRIPVFEDGIDNIIGILNVKDLLGLIVSNSGQFDIRQTMREVMYVPETSRCKDVFDEFRRRKVQLAVVVDEYGGTAGIITMEDILESIVGNIQDEYDHEAEEIVCVSQTEYRLAGWAQLEDIEETLDVKFPDAGDYETIAGYIIDKLGHLPEQGEPVSVRVSGWAFSVLDTVEHRIIEVLARKQESESAPTNTEAKKA